MSALDENEWRPALSDADYSGSERPFQFRLIHLLAAVTVLGAILHKPHVTRTSRAGPAAGRVLV